MKAEIITPECLFACEMIIGLDASLESKEIRKIYDESILLLIGSKYKFISISDFTNPDGQTIGEFLLDKHEDFAIALSSNVVE